MSMHKKLGMLFLAIFVVSASGCTTVSEEELDKKIDEAISRRFETETTKVDDPEFQAKVEAAIEAYIKKQEEEYAKAQEEANKPQEVDFEVSVDDDAILGDENAPVTIVEFSDFECPYCKRHFEQVLPLIKEKYIDTGKVRYVFRDLPMSFHEPLATLEALAANCAREQGGDEMYYKYHDKVYETTTSNMGLEEEQLYTIADDLGLDSAALKTCVADEKYADEIANDVKDAGEYGVQGTPNFFINNWHIKGAYPYETFEEYIEKELAK